MSEHILRTALRTSAAALLGTLRGRAHPRWREFLADAWGFPRVHARGRPVVWIVAAPGGEVIQATALGRVLREAIPHSTIVLSTSNHAFLEVARRAAPMNAYAYTPWDMGLVATIAARRVRPDVLVCVESAWVPKLLAAARRRGARTLLASGTMVASYHRAAPYRRAMRHGVLSLFDVVGVKGPEEVDAFTALGVPSHRIAVLGDLRRDPGFYAVSASDREALAARLGLGPTTPVLVGGSIHAGEAAIVPEACRRLRTAGVAVRAVIAPRYLATTVIIEAACSTRGLSTARASAGASDADVVILDSYGELPRVYALAAWAVVGGTFVNVDIGLGQNLLEPLAHGVPVFFGPHTARWESLTATLTRLFPPFRITDGEGLADAILVFERGPANRAGLQEVARDVFAHGADALRRHVDTIVALGAPAASTHAMDPGKIGAR